MTSQSFDKVQQILSKLSVNAIGKKGVIPTWIDLSEIKYGLKLPAQYRWFVENYDYIVLWGETTKTVFPPEYQDEADQDIFNYHALDLVDSSEQQAESKLVFLITDDLQTYYFPIKNNQVQDTVYYYDGWNDELYADNFFDFLLKEVPRNYNV